MAAQERTSEHASVADRVGVVAVLAAAAVAVTAPVATVGVAVVLAAVAAVRRRVSGGRSTSSDTSDGPDRPCPTPAACD